MKCLLLIAYLSLSFASSVFSQELQQDRFIEYSQISAKLHLSYLEAHLSEHGTEDDQKLLQGRLHLNGAETAFDLTTDVDWVQVELCYINTKRHRSGIPLLSIDNKHLYEISRTCVEIAEQFDLLGRLKVTISRYVDCMVGAKN